MIQDIRWKQRFQNLEKAYFRLKEACEIEVPNHTEEAGIIQSFEFTFELSWKTLKDYLELEGYTCKTPRETLKQSFQVGLIMDGERWLDALDKRNLMSHAYDESRAKEALRLIKDEYESLISALYKNLKEKI